MTGIYIHIPFCVKKCRYCDFPSYGGVTQFIEPYTAALCREISAWPGRERVDTIYFGGGTPSLLSLEQVGRIVTVLRSTFVVAENAEITFECNPDSVDAAYATGLATLGINRISMGIQSFDDQMLNRLGRIHTAVQAKQAIKAVKEAGINNISADLMFGLPGQDIPMLLSDMAMLITLPITHASIYSLIVEEHTMLWDAVCHGMVTLPDEDMLASMMESVWQCMKENGFKHYEISSYCKAGYESKHNLKYWRYEPYIGFGASAHSFFGDVRYANIHNIIEYMKRAGHESVIAEKVRISEDRAMEDYCFLALRTSEGIDFGRFKKYFSKDINSVFGNVLEKLAGQGLIDRKLDGCSLTKQGLAYGNYVFGQFIRS